MRPSSGSKTTVPFVVEMLALSHTARTIFSPRLYWPRCFGIGTFVALGEQRVGMGQVTETFGGIVLDGQIGQRSTRDQRQADGDLR